MVRGSFEYEGRTLAYESFGDGDRVVVLLHGLLLDARSNRGTARRIADAGYQVVCLDLLGHGRSDRPAHASEYRIDGYGEQVIGLLDHLGADDAVLVGTSLGANASLFAATKHPGRVRALVLEMPVLEWAVPSAALAFAPLLLAFHYGGPLLRMAGAAARSARLPWNLAESVLDIVRADPDATAAVLHGILVGPVAPTVEQRRSISCPLLVLAHRADPIHPILDARNLERHVHGSRLVLARTPLELRLRPRRLIGEIVRFIDDAYTDHLVVASNGNGSGTVSPTAKGDRRGARRTT